jgi:ribosomal subunit interface protein
MDVRITTRRATVGESFQKRIEERAARLDRYEPRLQSIAIVVDEDRGRVLVEVRAEVAGSPVLLAKGESSSQRSALDAAMQKLTRQLRRRRDRKVDHQAPPAGAVAGE